MWRRVIFGATVLASGWWAVDLYVWAVEVLAILAALAFARWAEGRRFGPLPRSFHRLLWTYVLIMLIGATWTYAAAPPGEWLRQGLGLARNPWDRIGHLFQGALPALFALHVWGTRDERQRPVPIASQLALGLAAGLAIAGLFEALEALAQVWAPTGVDFVQRQGDPNDRLWDLGLAGAGALAGTLATVAMARRERATRGAKPRIA